MARGEQPMYFQLLSALDVTYKVNGQAVAQGRVSVTARLTFTANDCLDLGSDLGPPRVAGLPRSGGACFPRTDTFECVKYSLPYWSKHAAKKGNHP